MTPQTAPASARQPFTWGRIFRLMAFIVITAVVIEIWNYAIILPFPALSISELGFMVGSLVIYYGPGRGTAQGKDWAVMAAVGLVSGWAANLAWIAYNAWA